MVTWKKLLRRPPAHLRLPQDVAVSGDRPETVGRPADVAELATRHRAAIQSGNHVDRAEALWGLVAHGQEATAWCEESLRSDDDEVIEDAAGVLAWIGTPPSTAPRLLERISQLPDGPARDAVVAALPAAARSSLFAADDAVGAGTDGAPFGPDHPEMTEVWFVEAPYDDAASAYGAWTAAIDPERRFSEHRGHINVLLGLLKPPVKPQWKTLLVETASPWTAVFEQSGMGADWVPRLARELRTRALRTSYSEHSSDDRGKVASYGDVAFWLFDGARDDRPLDEVRVVQANRSDSGWSWWLSGEPQPFEDLGRYAEKRIPRRFDRALLNRYCLVLGIRREDPAYYGPRATLAEAGWHFRR